MNTIDLSAVECWIKRNKPMFQCFTARQCPRSKEKKDDHKERKITLYMPVFCRTVEIMISAMSMVFEDDDVMDPIESIRRERSQPFPGGGMYEYILNAFEHAKSAEMKVPVERVGDTKTMIYSTKQHFQPLPHLDVIDPPKLPSVDESEPDPDDEYKNLTRLERAKHFDQEGITLKVEETDATGLKNVTANHMDPRLRVIKLAKDLNSLKVHEASDGTPLAVDMDNVCVDLTYNKTEKVLNFCGRRFSRPDLELLSEAMRMNSSVKHLSLAHCDLNSKDVRLATSFLAKNATLKKLDLSHNVITLAGAEALAEVLRENRTLKVLCLSKNYLGNDGCRVMLDLLKQNGTIEIVTLDYNGADNVELLHDIMVAAEQNTGGSAANDAKNIHERFRLLEAEHAKLKAEFKDYRRITMNTMMSPHERLQLIMAKKKPRRTGKGNWAKLQIANMFGKTLPAVDTRLKSKKVKRYKNKCLSTKRGKNADVWKLKTKEMKVSLSPSVSKRVAINAKVEALSSSLNLSAAINQNSVLPPVPKHEPDTLFAMAENLAAMKGRTTM